jgi:hypothetical protein
MGLPGFLRLAPRETFSGSTPDRESRAHARISSDSPRSVKTDGLDGGDAVYCEPLSSSEFPIKQGNNRESPSFQIILWPMTSGRATEMLGFFTKFSEEWNRELFFVIREGGAVPSKPIDEPSLLFPFHRTSVTYRFTSGRNTGKSQPSTG